MASLARDQHSISPPAEAAHATAAAAASPSPPLFEFDTYYSYSILVDSCSNLIRVDSFGSSDPFVILDAGESNSFKTPVVRNNLNPVFSELFHFVSPRFLSEFTFRVFDWDKITLGRQPKSLGMLTVRIDQLMEKFSAEEKSNLLHNQRAVKVFDGSMALSGCEHGEISFSLEIQSIPHLASNKHLSSSMDELEYLIDLTILEGRNYRSRGIFSGHLHPTAFDSFVVLKFGSSVFRSNSVANSEHPIFDEFCPLWVSRNSVANLIQFSVFVSAQTHSLALTQNAPKLLGVAFLKPKELKFGEKMRLKLLLNQSQILTDAQLNSATSGRGLGIPAEQNNENSKLPELWISVELKPRESVEQEFYRHLIDSYDQNHDGIIEEAELMHFLLTINDRIDLVALKRIFDSAADSTGQLDSAGLIKFFRHPQLNSIFPDFLRKIHALMTHGSGAMQKLIFETKKIKQKKNKSAEQTQTTQNQNNENENANENENELTNRDHSNSHSHSHSHSPLSSSDGVYVDHDNSAIHVIDRSSGLIVQEQIPSYLKSALRLLSLKSTSHSNAVHKTLKILTLKQGAKMDSPQSIAHIAGFIKIHSLNTQEIEKPISEYKSFNEFFYRKLKSGARTCEEPMNPCVAVSPADSRLLAFESIEESQELWIKGKNFTLRNLLADYECAGELNQLFNSGSIVVSRLAPQDFHRFHSPVSGSILDFFPTGDHFHSVSPLCIRRVDVFTENRRVLVPIETKEFGLVLFIAVAAAMVGSIKFTRNSVKQQQERANATLSSEAEELKSASASASASATGSELLGSSSVSRFDELGYFKFGGSTVLVLFQPGSIEFDFDLRSNTQRKLETLIKVGQTIGRATGKFQSHNIKFK